MKINGHVSFLVIIQAYVTVLVTRVGAHNIFLDKWTNKFESICELSIPGVLENIRGIFFICFFQEVIYCFQFLKKKRKIDDLFTPCPGLNFRIVLLCLGWPFCILAACGVLCIVERPHMACQGCLVREACVGVLVGRAGFLLSGVQ